MHNDLTVCVFLESQFYVLPPDFGQASNKNGLPVKIYANALAFPHLRELSGSNLNLRV